MTHITPHKGDRPDANRTPALRAEPRHFIKRRNERGSKEQYVAFPARACCAKSALLRHHIAEEEKRHEGERTRDNGDEPLPQLRRLFTHPRGKNAVHRHACRLASLDRAFADAAPISLAVFAAFFAAAFSSLLADDASTRFACSASLLARFSPTRNSEHCPGTRPSSAHNVASPACRRFQLRLASLRLGLGLLERRL